MHLNTNRGSKRPQIQKAIQNQEGAPTPWTPPPWHPGPTLSATQAHHRTTQRSPILILPPPPPVCHVRVPTRSSRIPLHFVLNGRATGLPIPDAGTP